MASNVRRSEDVGGMGKVIFVFWQRTRSLLLIIPLTIKQGGTLKSRIQARSQ